jgi:hypothetical protein
MASFPYRSEAILPGIGTAPPALSGAASASINTRRIRRAGWNKTDAQRVIRRRRAELASVVAGCFEPTSTLSPPEDAAMPSLRPEGLPSFATPGYRAFVAACVAASTLLLTPASHGQAGPAPGTSGAVPALAQQDPEPVNPAGVACNALKARLQSAGELRILSGPRGAWPDTFRGPAVPRCQFWQMPVFTYVRTSDGLCGVGYVCVDKLSRD